MSSDHTRWQCELNMCTLREAIHTHYWPHAPHFEKADCILFYAKYLVILHFLFIHIHTRMSVCYNDHVSQLHDWLKLIHLLYVIPISGFKCKPLGIERLIYKAFPIFCPYWINTLFHTTRPLSSHCKSPFRHIQHYLTTGTITCLIHGKIIITTANSTQVLPRHQTKQKLSTMSQWIWSEITWYDYSVSNTGSQPQHVPYCSCLRIFNIKTFWGGAGAEAGCGGGCLTKL